MGSTLRMGIFSQVMAAIDQKRCCIPSQAKKKKKKSKKNDPSSDLLNKRSSRGICLALLPTCLALSAYDSWTSELTK